MEGQPHPFSCSVEDPTKQTKFKGIKSYISYKLTPTHASSPVYRRYKHFDWLYNRLLHKSLSSRVPHLPEKQATGRFEEDFIEKRKRRLILWMDHMTSHPVLSQYEGFQHFLSCLDDKQWKMGKRSAEKDEMVVPASCSPSRSPQSTRTCRMWRTAQTPSKLSKKMDDSVLQSARPRSWCASMGASAIIQKLARLSRPSAMPSRWTPSALRPSTALYLSHGPNL